MTLASVVKHHREQPQPTFLHAFIHDLEADPEFSLPDRIGALAKELVEKPTVGLRDGACDEQHYAAMDTVDYVARRLSEILKEGRT